MKVATQSGSHRSFFVRFHYLLRSYLSVETRVHFVDILPRARLCPLQRGDKSALSSHSYFLDSYPPRFPRSTQRRPEGRLTENRELTTEKLKRTTVPPQRLWPAHSKQSRQSPLTRQFLPQHQPCFVRCRCSRPLRDAHPRQCA